MSLPWVCPPPAIFLPLFAFAEEGAGSLVSSSVRVIGPICCSSVRSAGLIHWELGGIGNRQVAV